MRWIWKIFMIVLLGPIYCSVIAEGLRITVPPLGQKLHKLTIPGFEMFGRFQETRRLDLAIFMAVILLLSVCWLWERVLAIYLCKKESSEGSALNPESYRKVIFTLGFIILGADGALLYASLSQMGWSGSAISLSALLTTAAYLAVIVFVSLVSVMLKRA